MTYRQDNHQPQNVYRGEQYIGVMFTAEDAALAVEAPNEVEREHGPALPIVVARNPAFSADVIASALAADSCTCRVPAASATGTARATGQTPTARGTAPAAPARDTGR